MKGLWKGILYALVLAVPAAYLGKLYPIIGGPVFGILLGIICGYVAAFIMGFLLPTTRVVSPSTRGLILRARRFCSIPLSCWASR